jgi:hypothetical protein
MSEHDSRCGACGRTWSASETPAPAARCPFEDEHGTGGDLIEQAGGAAMVRLRDALGAFQGAARELADAWLADELPAAAGEAIDGYPESWHAYEEVALEIAGMRVRRLEELAR